MTSSVELLGKYTGRGTDLLKIMHPVREWLGKTDHWQRAENGGCICNRLIKSSDRNDEQQALTAEWERFVRGKLREENQ